MDKVTIDRELLERVIGEGAGNSLNAMRELRTILAAPRQPEADGLEVVGLQWLDSGHYRKNPPKYGFNPHDWNELCRLSDAKRAIAELRDRLDVMTQCADNYSRMFEESSEECDKLAGLLRDISSSESRGLDWAKQIDAALAEVDK